MSDLSEPLSEDELELLDRFLLDRVNEEREDEPGFDCGIIDIGGLDGLLTALVSSPKLVPPSVWLPMLWGDDEPVWDSMDDFQAILQLMLRHMNSIAWALRADGDHFEPLFGESTVEGKTYSVVDDWCHGYMRVVDDSQLQWSWQDPAVQKWLEPIRLWGTEAGWKAIDAMPETEADRARAAIPEAVRQIYAYYQPQRTPATSTARRNAPKVGRNEPCPCGSGKKFKQCCLQ